MSHPPHIDVPSRNALASLAQSPQNATPVDTPPGGKVAPNGGFPPGLQVGKTYTSMKSTSGIGGKFTWAEYVSLREQGFIVEGPCTTGTNDPPVGITPLGVAIQEFPQS